jgi:hypothetical protein
MRTEDLIEILSRNVEPVDRHRIVRKLGTALGVSTAIVIGVVFFALGVRPDVLRTGGLDQVLVKVAFTTALLVPTCVYLMRLARPGGERNTSLWLLALPFVAIISLAAMSVALAPSGHWSKTLVGDEWLECVLSVPIIAIVPFAVIIWAVRQMAPTDLVRTGALAGLAAGCLSAAGYALHCADDSLPFVALWYGGTIALCTIAGAALGPRLLRW